jgi:hypothetical protein
MLFLILCVNTYYLKIVISTSVHYLKIVISTSAPHYILAVIQTTLLSSPHIGLWHGNECGKNKVMRNSREPTPVTIMIDQKQLENVECFKYLGSVLTNDVRRLFRWCGCSHTTETTTTAYLTDYFNNYYFSKLK